MKKYELTDETKVVANVTLHRIRALIDFELTCRVEIGAGDLGGWIEKEENLDQLGNAWVSDNARAYGDARVYGDALVSGDAWVSGNARVSGDARVSGNARVCGDALACGDARVSDNAWRPSKHAKAYLLAADLAETQIDLSDNGEGEA